MSEKKPPSRVQVKWQGKRRFDAGRPGGPTLRLDGSGETGQSPVDGVLSALASCVSIDVVEILAKRRTPVERLDVTVTGERADGTPRRLVAIELSFTLDGAGIDREQAVRAVDLSLNKYCSVRDSLARDIVITWNLVLNGEPGAPGEARSSI
ncbi:MAG: OsmC family protein [Gemmatimonadaceae bacterium]|nr:OsmC family protein [Gemmatimonadaceae bacterium]